MTEKQSKQLETLIGKLSAKLKNHRIAIISGTIHDGYHIALYNHNGDRIIEKAGPSIWSIIQSVDGSV